MNQRMKDDLEYILKCDEESLDDYQRVLVIHSKSLETKLKITVEVIEDAMILMDDESLNHIEFTKLLEKLKQQTGDGK